MADFRSLLSTFQAATTGDTPPPTPTKTLLEATTEQWRLVQLQKSMKNTNNTSDTKGTTSHPLHLAVCLCIVDDLPHQDIWKEWMSNGSASLYVHAKHPEKIASEWAKSTVLATSYKPDWNDVRIVRAMLRLAEEALKDENVSHVYFGTESCLPIASLEETLAALQPDVSYLDYYGKEHATRFEERECWSVVEQSIPSEAIYKALPGWCVLSRKHVQAILEIQQLGKHDLWRAFERCWAPEEVYFATALSLLGMLDHHQVKRKSLVHAEWNHRAQNQRDRAHPRTFDDDFGPDLVHYVRDKGCVFVRKVKRRMPLEKWRRVVLETAEPMREPPQDCSGRYERAQGSYGGDRWKTERGHRDRYDQRQQHRRRRRMDYDPYHRGGERPKHGSRR